MILYQPVGSKDISKLLVLLLLHMSWEQQKMACLKDGAVEHCRWMLSSPTRQPCLNTTPLLSRFMEEKQRVPGHWVAWGHFGQSNRHVSCPSVEERT